MTPAEAFLRDQIPLAQRAVIPTTLKTAYSAAARVIQAEPILNVASAQDGRGRFVQWAVDLAFEKLVSSGQWANGYEWRPFDKPTGRYLEIHFSHSRLTISQVANPKQQPRNVGFRANLRISNKMPSLFPEEPKPNAEGMPHILLMHGHQDLNFAHLAIPSANNIFGFQHRSTNLMNIAHLAPQEEVPMEQTDYDVVMELKEEIDKWRRDNNLG
ncbi:hypothetical protein FPZ54_01410 [Sphingomonas suaedae]|uniref:Uncharacterized protein n=1 Tax=Sphingomonas suaedae TaxID=2599297 RepID=A0A518RBT5_9SPHN|nr:hypothetical protein [Sphingomonas suaedae]QDX24821.1 hypothetical protein FPZ54_01410 [Sphingomonas suaedae]